MSKINRQNESKWFLTKKKNKGKKKKKQSRGVDKREATLHCEAEKESPQKKD